MNARINVWILNLLGQIILICHVSSTPLDQVGEIPVGSETQLTEIKPTVASETDHGNIDEPHVGSGILYDQNANDEMMLIEWIPHPINKYRYITLNGLFSIVARGEIFLDALTHEKFPKVKLILTCVREDANYVYPPKDMLLISVDALRDSTALQAYEDAIFTLHGFTYRVELWAHFMMYPEAFSPVINMLRMAYDDYLPDEDEEAGPPLPDEVLLPMDAGILFNRR